MPAISQMCRLRRYRAFLVLGLAAVFALPAGAAESASPSELRLPNTHAVVRVRVVPASVAPGGTAKLELTVAPDSGYKVYALSDGRQSGIARPALIRLTETSGLEVNPPVPDRAPIEEPEANPQDGTARYYSQPVTWTVPLSVPADAAAGPKRIEGVIAYQICYKSNCEMPIGVRFSGEIEVAPEPATTAGDLPLELVKASYSAADPVKDAAQQAGTAVSTGAASSTGPLFDGLQPRERNSADYNSLVVVLGASLIGGFLLNFMPCVLPVIGLKVLSFVNQGGDNRGRVFALNLWFVLGLLSVFMVLAGFAAFAQLGWGTQFQSTWFNVALSALVFAMALSFLGVWEIPIPGFVGSTTASELSTREGFFGAFAKGVITTVLSVPCSGPFLGPVFGFTLKESKPTIFLVFLFVGLGMASPYLLIGAFPRLVRFLPKPGAWMDTFKQIMGFFLLGTVVFLFTFIDKDYLPATFGLLVGIWGACWWIGRMPLFAELGQKLATWSQAAGVALLVGATSYYLFAPHETAIAWQPFSRAALEREVAQGRTVFVDFTADWCPTCKWNERTVLNTPVVSALVEKHGVVPMIADWTDGSDEIKDILEQLGSNSIPIYAIFSPDRPKEPIVLRDLVTKGQVIAALNEAGPSKMATVAATK